MPGSVLSKRVRIADPTQSIAARGVAIADRPSADPRQYWLETFRSVRAETERRAALLSPEDQVVQSMPDASPTKWHRAHVTWFFEQFLLKPYVKNYTPFDERFAYLVQFLLRLRRTARGAAAARPGDPAERGRDRGLSRSCRRGGVRSDRDRKRFRSNRSDHRNRTQSRATASGIVADRHLARFLAQRDKPGLRSGLAMAVHGPARRCRGRRYPASIPSATTATAFASTTKSRRIRSCCARYGFRRGWSATASGSISWPMAVTPRRRYGCRTVSRPSRRKAGTRRAIGARSTARGSR